MVDISISDNHGYYMPGVHLVWIGLYLYGGEVCVMKFYWEKNGGNIGFLVRNFSKRIIQRILFDFNIFTLFFRYVCILFVLCEDIKVKKTVKHYTTAKL